MSKDYFNIKEATAYLKMVIAFNQSTIRTSRLVPVLVGNTGIAKTESTNQLSDELGIDNITLHLSQLEPSDFVGLPEKTGEGFTRNCPPNWLPLKPWPEGRPLSEFEYNKGWIHPKGGIVFLDELNRAPEDMRQACMQFLNTGRIHTFQLPDNYFVFGAMNPSTAEGNYEVAEFDEAGINRIVQMKFKPTSEETLDYLTTKYGKSNMILGWIKSDKNATAIDYGGAFEVTDPKYSPRMVENSAKMLSLLKGHDKGFIKKVMGTMMDEERLAGFITFLDQCDQFNYIDVIEGNKDKIEETILIQKRIDVVGFAISQLCEVVEEFVKKGNVKDLNGEDLLTEKSKDKFMKNLIAFLKLCPDELKGAFINGFKSDVYAHPKCPMKDKDFIKEFKPVMIKYKKAFE